MDSKLLELPKQSWREIWTQVSVLGSGQGDDAVVSCNYAISYEDRPAPDPPWSVSFPQQWWQPRLDDVAGQAGWRMLCLCV
eukprot:g29801.t1